MMELRLSVGGDPDGGWLVDLHDGDKNMLFRPGSSCKTAAHAAMAALVEYEGPEAAAVEPPEESA